MDKNYKKNVTATAISESSSPHRAIFKRYVAELSRAGSISARMEELNDYRLAI